MQNLFMKKKDIRFVMLGLTAGLMAALAEAQDIKTYPVSWWTGMKQPVVQVMLHGNSELPAIASVSHPGVTVKRVYQPDNKRYLFVDLHIAPSAKAGNV
ncbi:MAG: cyclomaltodextrinase N-terminal domain-containing protein, partial [bacterium]